MFLGLLFLVPFLGAAIGAVVGALSTSMIDMGISDQFIDGVKKKAYYIARATLGNIPEEVMNDGDLDGWDLEIKPLAPTGGVQAIQKFTTENPLA